MKERKEINERFLRVMKDLIYEGAVKNQADFAQKVGISATRITDMKTRDDRNVTVDMVVHVCNTFGISANWLLLGKGAMKTENSLSVEELAAKVFRMENEMKNREKTGKKNEVPGHTRKNFTIDK